MRIAVAAAAVAMATACITPRPFPCDEDADCAIDGTGRCELAVGACSFLDPGCPSGWRFGEHAAGVGGTCVEIPPRPLSNACVAGEKWPTTDQPCADRVCARLPTCCAGTWSEACVRLADQLCDGVTCGEWLAAITPTGTQVLHFTGGAGFAEATSIPAGGTRLAWLHAQPNRPLLVIANGAHVDAYRGNGADDALVFGTLWSHDFINTNLRITSLAGGDVDNDDELEVSVGGTGGTGGMARLVVLSGPPILEEERINPDAPSNAAAWADADGNRFLDYALATPSNYRAHFNRHPVADYGTWILTGGNADPPPVMTYRDVAWAPIDGDGEIDYVVIGTRVRVHLGSPAGPAENEFFTVETPLSGTVLVGAVGDLDGDMLGDVVTAVSPDEIDPMNPPPVAGRLAVHHGFAVVDGDPSFSRTYVAPDPIPPITEIRLADVDDDSRLDVIAAVGSGGLILFRNVSQPGAVALDPPVAIGDATTATATWFDVTGWASQ